MKSGARVLTNLTILLAITLLAKHYACAKDPFVTPDKRSQTKESFVIKGEHISQIFASACAENTFAEYQGWSLKNHFMLRQFESPKYQISQNEIRDDELLFSVTINDQNKWQAKLRDQKFVGDDPCEVANAYLSARAPKQISIWSFIIPEAQAQKLVNEATATNWLLGALATAAVTEGSFIESLANKFTLSNSHFLATAFRSMSIAGQDAAQTNFEKLLLQPELMCSRNRAKIYGKEMHIIVKKGYIPYRLGFHVNLTGKPLKTEAKILESGRVYEHLLSLGQRCNHDGDATSISAQLKAERDLLNMKIARASLLNRTISSEK